MKNRAAAAQGTDWDAQRYDDWYDTYRFVYESELNAVRALLPHAEDAVEIGIGTGRFSSQLGIRLGVEPSPGMSEIAVSRGLGVVSGKAEALPFADSSFDLVLFVTALFFVENLDRALNDSYRVLRADGSIVIGFLDFGTPLGQGIRYKKADSTFPKRHHFLSSDDLARAVTETGFTDIRFVQTLFRPLDQVKKVELVKNGHGRGLFAVLRAEKRGSNINGPPFQQ